MSDLSSFREQAEAVVARHTDSHWCGGCSAGRSFYMKHDPGDAHTQATRVLELVKMARELLPSDDEVCIVVKEAGVKSNEGVPWPMRT
jgi:hypothetical protein